MKRSLILISIISFLSILTSKSFGQGNLQFNQVLTYTGNCNVTNPAGGSYLGSISPTYTVPTGKVWKVEAISFFNNNGVSGFLVNGTTTAFANLNSKSVLPFWLKGGDQFSVGNSGAQTDYFISIVEFNIVP